MCGVHIFFFGNFDGMDNKKGGEGGERGMCPPTACSVCQEIPGNSKKAKPLGYSSEPVKPQKAKRENSHRGYFFFLFRISLKKKERRTVHKEYTKGFTPIFPPSPRLEKKKGPG